MKNTCFEIYEKKSGSQGASSHPNEILQVEY
jgi:hypothetical protein